jgi:hypothetical protein
MTIPTVKALASYATTSVATMTQQLGNWVINSLVARTQQLSKLMGFNRN